MELAAAENLMPMRGGFYITHHYIMFHLPVTGIKQLYRYDGISATCMTCQDIDGGPTAAVRKGACVTHPNEEYVFMSIEMVGHPFPDDTGDPGGGWFNDLWAAKIDGSGWWNLTNYPNGEADRYGALKPTLNAEVNKIAWGQLYDDDPAGQASYALGNIVENTYPLGLWKLNIADIVFTEGVPSLANIVSSAVGSGHYYEPVSWFGDKLLFASDIGKTHFHQMDMFMLNVTTDEITNITDDSDSFCEFGTFSPDGQQIIYMTTKPYTWVPLNPNTIPFSDTLRTELYLYDPDGDDVQLTDFSELGLVTDSQWLMNGIYYGVFMFDAEGEYDHQAIYRNKFINQGFGTSTRYRKIRSRNRKFKRR